MPSVDTPLPRSPRLTRNHPLARYLGISPMTLWRWKRDPTLNFPAPSVVNDIEYNDLNLIDDWLVSRRVDRAQQRTTTITTITGGEPPRQSLAGQLGQRR